MQTILPSEFKRGMVLLLDGAPQVLEEFHLSGTAQTKHKLHLRLRNLKTGRIGDRVLPENERVPMADLEHRRVTFSYQQGDSYVFLDAVTYEELNLSGEQVGDRRWFLKENEEYRALILESKLLDIVLPLQVTLKIVETSPPMKGGSDSTWKEAQLETGLQIMVPLFIEQGEAVRVDTQQRKYMGKETLSK
jgi:elongation factor P